MPISQKVFTTLGIDLPIASTTSTGIDLSNCTSYFDGCNTCFVQGGQIGGCTRMYCETPAEPKCLEYVQTGIDILSGNTETITGGIVTSIIPANMTVFSDLELNISFYYPNTW